MRVFSLDSNALALSIAGAFLAGCAGSQPPISTPGATPQSRAIAARTERGGSWMLPEANGSGLLYASDWKHSVVLVYSYPTGDRVGELQGFPAEPAGLCSDRSGNVYVTTQGNGSDFTQSYVYEYAHGGTAPIAILSDPGYAYGCSVDRATGNLAVTNLAGPSGGKIAVYQSAQGTPTTYSDPNVQGFVYCTYDNSGNLFATVGQENIIDTLPNGSSGLREIQLSNNVNSGSIQSWRGRLVIANVEGTPHGDQMIFNVSVSGSTGTVRGPRLLQTSHATRPVGSVQFWTQGSTIIGPSQGPPGINGLIEFWKYPKGGLATKGIRSQEARAFIGVTVSLTPSRQAEERSQ